MKNEKSSFILMIVSIIMLFSIVFFNIFIFFNNLTWINISLYSLICVLISVMLFGYIRGKEVYFKLGIATSVLLTIIYLIYFTLTKNGIIERISSFDDLRQLILDFGSWGVITYIVINLLQCVVIPIPTTLTVLVGTAIYGPLSAFAYATLGVILGSSISFFIGRYCSRPVINWIFGKEKIEKYQNVLNSRVKLILFLTLILPFFPDDLICMLAGITDIKYYQFLLIALFSRGVGLATISFLGSGRIIPFSGWGIAVWIVIGIAVLGCVVFAFVKREKIKHFLRIKD